MCKNYSPIYLKISIKTKKRNAEAYLRNQCLSLSKIYDSGFIGKQLAGFTR